MGIDAVLFDFDGVIQDSFSKTYNWCKFICNVFNKKFPYKDIEEFRESFREPYPNIYIEMGFDWEKDKEIIKEEFVRYDKYRKTKIFDGIEDVIKGLYLKGKKLAIVSSNRTEVIKDQLKKNNLEKYFDLVIAENELPTEDGKLLIKPHPASILIALERLNCKPGNAIYIGDQPTDIIACRKVKEFLGEEVKAIAVNYGKMGIEERFDGFGLEVINTVEELKKVLEEII